MRFKSLLIVFGLILPSFGRAEQMERLTPDDVQATLAAFKIANQKDLSKADCAHLLAKDWFIADSTFASSLLTAQAMNYMLPDFKGGLELIRIFKLASSDPPTFRPELDRWLLKKGQLKTITLSELKLYLKAKRTINLPIFDSPEDRAKGFISHKAYAYAFARGFFPIGDPHDVFFHIPAFLDPRFADALKRIAQLIFETAGQKKCRALSAYLTGPMREVGVENWSFLYLNSRREPRLFLQGNQPFFALTNLAGQVPNVRTPVTPFINFSDSQTSIRDFEKLPRWSEFVAQKKLGSPLFRLNAWLKQLEVSKSAAADADARLSLRPSSTAIGALESLARFVSQTAEIRPAFSSDVRSESAKLLLDMIQLYWEWIQQQP